jgi:RHS repeat-associated protein
MTNAGGTVTYSYNALELRVGKTGPTALVPTGAAYYVYDEAGKLLGEYDANGVPVYETTYMGLPVGVVKQTGTAAANDIVIGLYNVSADQLGVPRIITRQSDEALTWRWDSVEAFGTTAPDQNPSGLGTFSFNQRLSGQVFDAESGLFQNWNREYNPRIGQYMQSDPIGLAGGISTFAYVEGNPLGTMDPMGLAPPGTWDAILRASGVSNRNSPPVNPRLPDGISVSAPLFGPVSGNLTIDRYGNFYFGPGAGVPDVGASACWIPTKHGGRPTEQETTDFFNGFSANAVFGIGLTYVPGYSPAITVGTPSLGFSTVKQVK